MQAYRPLSAAAISVGLDLIYDALPFGRLWYAEANAISKSTAG
jgi:hypothetical protein